MVFVGRSKFDKNGRVSLIKDIADLLNLMEGDYIEYHVENGSVQIRKMTKSYQGFDFESDEIKERLISYEEQHGDNVPEEVEDPEAAKRMAREQYEKDKAAREALRKVNG